MTGPIIFDLLRLFLSAAAPGPRGIARVDMLYARFLFANWPADCAGLLITPWGPRLFHRRRVLRALDALDALWHERLGLLDTGCYAPIDHTEDAAGIWPVPGLGKTAATVARLGGLLARTGVAAGSPLSCAAPDAIYLNTGQAGCLGPWLTRWLPHRSDIRPVFMVHEVAPLCRSDTVTPRCALTFCRIVKIAAAHHGGLLFNAQSARQSVNRYLGSWAPKTLGQAAPLTTAIPLPVSSLWMAPASFQEPLRPAYFIAVGAIEPCKNYALLLQVWEELLRRRGVRTPGLVIVGAIAAGSSDFLDELRSLPHLQGYIRVCSKVPWAALRRLIGQARALVMPSLAAGRGLVIAESLAAGTPVLASDLPMHREVGGGFGVYLNPTDPAGWLREVAAFADGEMGALRRRIARYEPVTYGAYFVQVTRFLEAVTERTQRASANLVNDTTSVDLMAEAQPIGS